MGEEEKSRICSVDTETETGISVDLYSRVRHDICTKLDKAETVLHLVTCLNYTCLQYDFGHQGYPVDGIQFNAFNVCSPSMRKKSVVIVVKERKLHRSFQIPVETGSLRQETAAAVSDDQAFFYFRQTSEPSSRRPIIQSRENGPWEIAIEDLMGKQVIKDRDTKLSNVYIENKNEVINVFVTGIIPRRKNPKLKPVKAYH